MSIKFKEKLKNYIDYVLEAIKLYGSDALKYASDELKADKEVVSEAVKNNGLALEYASDELKADRKIIIEAIKQDDISLQYASDKLPNFIRYGLYISKWLLFW